MLKKNKFCLDRFFYSLVFFSSILISQNSFAADSLSYSGRLVKADGAPVAGPVDLTVDLAYTNAPGTILCSQNFDDVILSNGVFHLKLDLVCPGPPAKTLTEILSAIPATFAAALRVTDVNNSKVYAFQALHAMPFANIAETSKQLVQLGAANGQVLKWNDTTKKWEPGTPGGGGTVTNVTATSPLAILNGATTPALSITQATATVDGYLSAADWSTFNAKIGLAAGGTVSDYYRGDKTWQTLNSDAVPVGATNLYFTNALALGVQLGATLDVALLGPITSADTILTAFGRTQNQINLINTNSSAYVTKMGTSTMVAAGTIDAQLGFVLVGAPGSINDATPRGYVNDQDALKVSKAGDTMSGVLTLDNDLKIKSGTTTNYVTIKGHATSDDYSLFLPQTDGNAGEVLQTDGVGNLIWINPDTLAAGTGTVNSSSITDDSIVNADINSAAGIAQSKIAGLTTDLGNKISTTLTNGKMLVGNLGNLAVPVTMSGDATLDNAGVLTLANTAVTPNTYTAITVDAKGRVTNGSNPTTLAGYGILDVLVKSISVNAPLTNTGTASIPLIAMPAATTSVDGYLTSANWTTFYNKQDAITANSTVNARELRFNELAVNGTEYVALKSPDTLAANTTYTLPAADGSSGQVLTTNAAGALSWTTVATSGTTLAGDVSGTISANTIGAGKVTSTHILDATIVNADISATANIDATKLGTGVVTTAEFNYLDGVTSGIQTQLNAKQATGNYVTALTGDVTAAGPGSAAATVAAVGGVTAANVATGATLANAATNLNTASAIVKRDASGNFAAGTITATLNGTATNVTGTVAVANGGTGKTTLGLNQLLFGNGTSAINELALPGLTTTSVLLSTVTTGAPLWTTSTAGNVLKGSVTGVTFGPLSSTDLPAGTLSGSGTVNYVPYYSAATTLANSPMAISGGNVGIGTAVPVAPLDIGGTTASALRAIFTRGASDPGFRLTAYNGSGSTTNSEQAWFGMDYSGAKIAGISYIRSGSANGSMNFQTNNGAGVTNAMSIDINGNVGVGNDSPGSILEIGKNTATSSSFRFSPSADQSAMRFTTNGAANWIQSGSEYIADSKKDLRFSSISGTTTWMSIQGTTGNVGIGTTTPQSKLDINGAIRVGVDATVCSATISGAMRFNTPNVEFCNGTSWAAFGTSGAAVASSQITDGTVVDADINAAANIAATKMGTGLVDNTEFNYLNGVTSSIQTQFSGKQAADATLTSLAAYNTNGILVQTAADTFLGRSIAGVANRIVVTNGNGVAGNPTVNIDTTLLPSPLAGDAGKMLKASGANASVWTALGLSDITTALGYTPVNKAGDSLTTGTIALSGSAALTVQNPVNVLDAVNKQYVDGFGQWTKTGSDIYRGSGNVGIGTTTPNYKLDVGGVASFGGGNGNLDPAGTLTLTALQNTGKSLIGWNRAAGEGEMDFINNRGATGTVGGFKFYDYTNAGVLNQLMTITGSGNVGIGTTTPQQSLHIASSSFNEEGYPGIFIQDPTTSNAYGGSLYFDDRGGLNVLKMSVTDNSIEKGFIALDRASGNVGIGTITPSQKMVISAGQTGYDQGVPSNTGSTQNSILRLSPDIGSWGEVLDFGLNVPTGGGSGPTGSTAWIQANNRTNLSIGYNLSLNPNGGNVGIGTTAPARNFVVVDQGGGVSRGISSRTYAANPGGVIEIAGSLGTLAAPSALTINKALGYLAFNGFDGTDTTLQSQPTGMQSFTTENWTSTTKGSNLYFTTTPNGTFNGVERMRIDQNGNIGIGTTAPNYLIDVRGTGTSLGSFSSSGDTLGYLDIQNSSTGNSAGSIARLITKNVANTTSISVDIVKYRTGGFVINNNETDVAAYMAFNQSGAERMRITSAGKVGIGAVTPLATLHVAGTGYINDGSSYIEQLSRPDSALNVTNNHATKRGFTIHHENSTALIAQWYHCPSGVCAQKLGFDNAGNMVIAGLLTQSSDERLKKNIEPLESSLEKILNLQGVSYYWKDKNTPGKQVGLIAQEVEKQFPEAVRTDKDGWKSVAYQNLVAPMINAIKELHSLVTNENGKQDREIASLKESNLTLNTKMDSLEKQNQELKAAICEINPKAKVCGRK